jgi:RNA polymerase sigma-70 factor (ECF subfamily)
LLDADQQTAVAEGLAAGQAEAWAALYDAYAAEVWRYVGRLVGSDAHAVADVVQETMLAAARSARTYDVRRGSLAGWLMGIAHKQAAQHFRRTARMPRSTDRLDDGSLAAVLEAPDELARQEQTEQVRQALAEMPAEHAWLLAAKYADGRPIAALADELSTTSDAVKSKLARARRLFRQTIGRQSRGVGPSVRNYRDA